jgi:signal transduction histidine kinase
MGGGRLRLSLTQKVLSGFVGAMLILVALVGVVIVLARHSAETQRWVAHSYVVLGSLDGIVGALDRAESDQRAFFITGDRRYFLGRDDALLKLESLFVEVKEQTSDNPSQQSRLPGLGKAIQAKLENMKTIGATRPEARSDAAWGSVEDNVSGMPAIRAAVGEMQEEERQLLAQRSETSTREARLVPLAMGVVCLALLVFFSLFFRRILREMREHRRAETRLREAIEAIPEGFMLFDADDRLVLSNNKLDELYPLTAAMHRPGNRFEDMLRKGLAQKQFLGALGREDEWVAERLQLRRTIKGSVEQSMTDGRWVLIDDHRTRDGGWVGTRRDITAIKLREAELLKAKEEAEVASQAKSEFLSHMSHELRTPLNAIIGFSELIQREINGPVGDASYLDYAANIHTSGEHLLTVVNDILDLSKIEAGRLVLSEDEIEIAALSASAIRMLGEQAKAAGLTIVTEIDAHLPRLLGDERALRQVLLNLLGNAIKFSFVGGCISLECALDADGGLTISVSDSGIGIAADDLARIMEPFGQVEEAFSRRYQGTGLGLPIAKRLTEAMSGQLTIESHLKVGTRVMLRFAAERLVMPLAAVV